MEKEQQSKLMEQARKRFKASVDFDRHNREDSRDDLAFLSGEEQWDPAVKKSREEQGRPCLTFNKLPQFVDQVTGDSRQNKPSIKIRPADSQGDKALAEIYNGIIRNIAQTSQADIARDTAQQAASECGFGAYRILTEYAGEDTFDQDIKVKRISNQFSAHFDPEAKEWDKSDGKYWFITDRVRRESLEEDYPKAKEIAQWNDADSDWKNSWIFDNEVLVAEYFVKEPITKTIYLLSDGTVTDVKPADPANTGPMQTVQPMAIDQTGVMLDPRDLTGMDAQSGMQEGSSGPLLPGTFHGIESTQEYQPGPQLVRSRTVRTHRVMWYKIAGDVILEGPKELPGTLIPIIPVFGKEINIQGKTHYRGVIRFAKDAQRLYNYWRSNAAEAIGTAPKSPFIGTPKMTAGYENMWQNSHKTAYPVLYCNPDPNFPGMMPQRVPQPEIPTAFHQEAMMNNDEFKSTTGIYDPSLGARSNETSGRAILARQREADTGTFPYIDNLSRAMHLEARILIEWIPKIYDTDRVIRILGDDGGEDFVPINRTNVDPVTGEPIIDPSTGNPQIVNDLAYGKYDAVITIGPSYATQRLEAADSMIQFVQAVPPAGAVMGDLLAESMDWPQSDKIAERLRAMLPPQIAAMGGGGEGRQQMPTMDQGQQVPSQQQPQPDPLIEIKTNQEVERLKGLQLDNLKKELEIRRLLGQPPPDIQIDEDGLATGVPNESPIQPPFGQGYP